MSFLLIIEYYPIWQVMKEVIRPVMHCPTYMVALLVWTNNNVERGVCGL